MSRYLDLLEASIKRRGGRLCVGIDPDPAHLPAAFSQGEEGLRRWCELLISATADHAAAYKMNLAFFEAYGSGGMRVAESIRTLLPSDTPLIIDVKRGDIGSTVAAQARALYDVLGADAVTANPYLGIGALEPLLTREDRFVYLLCRTSNPEAPELQELQVAADGSAPEEALYLRVARLAAARPEARAGRIGLVAGATAAAAMAQLRGVAPNLPLLVPGIGAQGGDLAAVLAHGETTGTPRARVGGSLLVNVGRGISGSATDGGATSEAIHARSAEWASRLAILTP
uniref:orotidine-5'-phosphate decarboxylase n=1 Tax=Candidatus Limnocylindrus sp. TaxID=2802978 RepID=UPI0040495D42